MQVASCYLGTLGVGGQLGGGEQEAIQRSHIGGRKLYCLAVELLRYLQLLQSFNIN